MKTQLTLFCLAVTIGTQAQGTLEDYRRAYSLQDKFGANKVMHWARNIQWKDSSAVFTYETETENGRMLTTYNAETKEKTQKAYKQEKPKQDPGSPFRQHERHWMEIDEETEQRVCPSPDGKWEAWIEGYNLILHEKGKPFSQKRQLSQDGTIGEYYSNQIYWSPDCRHLFVCKRKPVEKRYAYYVESSPKDQLQPILHKQEYAKPGDQLPYHTPVMFSIDGSRHEGSTELCKEQYDLNNFEWSEDGKEIFFDFNERGHKHYRVLAMNAENGSVRTVVEEQSSKFVNYSRQYRQFLNHSKQLLWMSERDNWNHLYLYDTEKAKVLRQITRGEWCVRQVLRVDEEKSLIYFTASGVDKDCDPYLIKYYKVGLGRKEYGVPHSRRRQPHGTVRPPIPLPRGYILESG